MTPASDEKLGTVNIGSSSPATFRNAGISTRYRGITYRKKAGGQRAYFVFCGGKHHSVDGGEQEALRLQASLRSKPKARVVTNARFSEMTEQWFASKRHLRASTLTAHRIAFHKHVMPAFGDRLITSITPPDIAKFIQELEDKDLKPATIRQYLQPLSGPLGFAASQGLLTVNPVLLLTRDQRPGRSASRQQHVWDDLEIKRLLEASRTLAARPVAQYDYTPLLTVALRTGLRLGELHGLWWTDIDFTTNELQVLRQWTKAGEITPPKSEAGIRRLPLPDDLVEFLREDHDQHVPADQPSEYVFPSLTGGPLSHRNVQRRGFAPAAALAGIDGVTFHSMRNAFASRMIFNGIEADTLARLMGSRIRRNHTPGLRPAL